MINSTFKRLLILTAATLLTAFSAAFFFQSSVQAQGAGAAEGVTENPFEEGNQKVVAAGQQLFTGKLGCYGCHGQAGGGGRGPSLVDAEWIYGDSDASLFETLRNGRPSGMPAFGDSATHRELWQVIAFLRSINSADGEQQN